MAPRALGALFALAAAIAFAASIATSAWWAGAPTVNGHYTSAKYVHAGLLGAQGCNTGGNGACETIEVDDTLRLATYGELGVSVLDTLLLFLLAMSAWRVGDGRKGLAKAALVTTLLAAAGAGAVLALGPALQVDPGTTVEVPIGYGVAIFGGAIAAAFLGSLLALKIVPEPLRLKPGVAPTMQGAPPDIRDILRADHDGIRPSQQNMYANAPQLRPLYDAAGVPPAPITPSVPLRAPTPIPRARIDVLTGNATPPPIHDPRVPAPLPYPTPSTPAPAVPVPDAFGRTQPAPPMQSPDAFGRTQLAPPTPSPDAFGRTQPAPSTPSHDAFGRTQPAPSTPSPDAFGRTQPAPSMPMRPKPPSVAPPPTTSPPMRSKPPSAAPPLGRPKPPGDIAFSTPIARSGNAPPRAKPPSVAPPAPQPSVAPPAKQELAGATPNRNQPKQPRAKTLPSGTDPGKPSAVPMPARASQPAMRPSAPTLAHAIPPMPTADNLPAPSVLPAQRMSTDADDSLETGMRETEHITAVEIDHEAKAAAQHAKHKRGSSPAIRPPIGAQRAESEVRTGKQATVGDITETGVEIGVATDPERAAITDQQPVVRPSMPPVYAPISETFPIQRISEIVPASIVPDEGSLSAEYTAQADAESMQRGSPAGDKTPIPTLGARDTSRMQTETPLTGTNLGPKFPASTAPSTLPPPKNLASETPSGPTPACPQCEAPMAWVEEHLRFYCKSCRMYF